jgi:hypothetical protein
MFGGSRAKLFSRLKSFYAGLENFFSRVRTFSDDWKSCAARLKSFAAG